MERELVSKRSTTQKRAIERLFEAQQRPLSVEEIVAFGRAEVESLNQATVYRNLKTLLEEGWLTRVMHPTLGTLYERSGKRHHHHFHCHGCKRVFDLPGCPLVGEAEAPEGFLVESHEVFYFGLCSACSQAPGRVAG